MSTDTIKKIISRLAAEGVTEGPEGTRYFLHYDEQSDEAGIMMTWNQLIDTLHKDAQKYGLCTVLDAAYCGPMKMSYYNSSLVQPCFSKKSFTSKHQHYDSE
ncbi:MAG: hypothetical protein HGB35_00395 [Geobacteraceae bacterium]|nr:hypothetical protein [Geobacteraceae bacterium]